MLLHIVADYGYGDLAFAEVVQRIRTHLPDAEPVLTPVPPFATLAAGFCIAQLALNAAPPGTIVYHNVAPRPSRSAGPTRSAPHSTLPPCLRCPRGASPTSTATAT